MPTEIRQQKKQKTGADQTRNTLWHSTGVKTRKPEEVEKWNKCYFSFLFY